MLQKKRCIVKVVPSFPVTGPYIHRFIRIPQPEAERINLPYLRRISCEPPARPNSNYRTKTNTKGKIIRGTRGDDYKGKHSTSVVQSLCADC